jgi:DNA polymerase III subunit alpha
VAAIIEARGAGSPAPAPFVSLWDFCERVDPQVVNKRALESLVKCGALDSTGASRKGMLAVLEQALAWGARQHSDRLVGQASIFDVEVDAVEPDRAAHHPVMATEEFEKADLLAMEKESLGLWVSEHPLHGLKDALRRKADVPLVELAARRDGDVITVGGIVGAIRSVTTRKGDPMAFVRLDDLSGSTEVIVFNSAYAAARDLLEEDRVLLVKGRVDHKDGETKMVALEVTAFEVAAERSEVRLRVDARRATSSVIRELAEVVRGFPGEAAVVVSLETSEGPRLLAFGPSFKVRPEPDFFAEVKALLGEAAVA